MRKYSLLLLLVFLGGVLRIANLSKYPTGFNSDEAAMGYNAYSLLVTGKDEWGAPWWHLPFTNLRSFGEYKTPLYTFITIPSVKFFGLTETATRLPNALLGSLAIAVVYFLTLEFFSDRRAGLVAAFLLAVSPWHISLSRLASEANLITFFLPLGLLLFIRRSYLWSMLTFAAALYSYHSARLVIPVSLLVLFIYSKRNLSKKLIFSLILLFLLALPALVSYLGAGGTRVSDVGLFSPTDNWGAVADRRFAARAKNLPDKLARIFSNKPVYVLSQFTKSYLSYLSPDFLFTQGVEEATYGMIPNRGVLYYSQIPLLLAFFVLLIKKPDRKLWLLLALFMISPLPAAMTKGIGVAGNRSAAMLPFLCIMSAIGLSYLSKYFRYAATVFVCLTLILFVFFLEDYVYHAPNQNGPAMSYGWKETLSRLAPLAQRYSDVRFSRSLSEPQIFMAFYWQFPPIEYQKFSQSWPRNVKFLDQYDGYYLDKFRFGDIHPQDKVDHPILFVGRPENFPDKYPEYFHIDYPNGQTAIKVAEALPK